jgi:hypothetical protein
MEKVAIEDALRLVPVDHPALRKLYPAAAIPAGTYYPWQRQEVPTVASRALLMTLRWTDPAQEETCRLVGKIARIIVDNRDHLRRAGDPKWREVEPGAVVTGWERSPCVAQALTGPDRYVLSTGAAAPSTATSTGAAPAEDPVRPGQPPGSTCAAETDPVLRRLCEVRPLLRPEP